MWHFFEFTDAQSTAQLHVFGQTKMEGHTFHSIGATQILNFRCKNRKEILYETPTREILFTQFFIEHLKKKTKNYQNNAVSFQILWLRRCEAVAKNKLAEKE